MNKRVKITDKLNQVYEGIIHEEDECRIVLRNCKNLTTNLWMGTLTIYAEYEPRVEIISTTNEFSDIDISLSYSDRQFESSRKASIKSTSHSSLDKSFLKTSSSLESDLTDISFISQKSDIRESDLPRIISDYTSSEIILKTLSSKEIGFEMLTDEWKRYSKISLICLHSEERTFIFDLISISKELNERNFLHGIKFFGLFKKYIIDSNSSLIMYDSPHLVDVLYHQYRITLKDFVDLKELNKIMSITQSSDLESLIKILPNSSNKSKYMDFKSWNQRPIDISHQCIAKRKVCFLVAIKAFFCNYFLKLSNRNSYCLQKINDDKLLDKEYNKFQNKNSNSTENEKRQHTSDDSSINETKISGSSSDGLKKHRFLSNLFPVIKKSQISNESKEIEHKQITKEYDTSKYNFMPAGYTKPQGPPKSSNFKRRC